MNYNNLFYKLDAEYILYNLLQISKKSKNRHNLSVTGYFEIILEILTSNSSH